MPLVRMAIGGQHLISVRSVTLLAVKVAQLTKGCAMGPVWTDFTFLDQGASLAPRAVRNALSKVHAQSVMLQTGST